MKKYTTVMEDNESTVGMERASDICETCLESRRIGAGVTGSLPEVNGGTSLLGSVAVTVDEILCLLDHWVHVIFSLEGHALDDSWGSTEDRLLPHALGRVTALENTAITLIEKLKGNLPSDPSALDDLRDIATALQTYRQLQVRLLRQLLRRENYHEKSSHISTMLTAGKRLAKQPSRGKGLPAGFADELIHMASCPSSSWSHRPHTFFPTPLANMSREIIKLDHSIRRQKPKTTTTAIELQDPVIAVKQAGHERRR